MIKNNIVKFTFILLFLFIPQYLSELKDNTQTNKYSKVIASKKNNNLDLDKVIILDILYFLNIQKNKINLEKLENYLKEIINLKYTYNLMKTSLIQLTPNVFGEFSIIWGNHSLFKKPKEALFVLALSPITISFGTYQLGKYNLNKIYFHIKYKNYTLNKLFTLLIKYIYQNINNLFKQGDKLPWNSGLLDFWINEIKAKILKDKTEEEIKTYLKLSILEEFKL